MKISSFQKDYFDARQNAMKIRMLILILGIVIFCGCGRTDNAYVINNTSDTLSITLKLNYPPSEEKPDNSLREEIVNKEKSKVKDWKLGGDCVIDFDTVRNIAKIILFPNDKLNLGTIRVGSSRNNFQSWEFTEINAKGRNVQIDAKGKGIMSFVKKEKAWFSQDSHYFLIGQESY